MSYIHISYNEKHGITPTTVRKSRVQILAGKSVLDIRGDAPQYYVEPEGAGIAAEPVIAMASKPQLEKMIAETERKMKAAAKELDFITAAQLRDEMLALKRQLAEKP